mmetsp:Transcript_57895/g.136429  ORF Transcript_57895/g.136429 Transcript_57895/m.136429 type:complete len:204 (-) Transcript_57895:1399-2010(-)
MCLAILPTCFLSLACALASFLAAALAPARCFLLAAWDLVAEETFFFAAASFLAIFARFFECLAWILLSCLSCCCLRDFLIAERTRRTVRFRDFFRAWTFFLRIFARLGDNPLATWRMTFDARARRAFSWEAAARTPAAALGELPLRRAVAVLRARRPMADFTLARIFKSCLRAASLAILWLERRSRRLARRRRRSARRRLAAK